MTFSNLHYKTRLLRLLATIYSALVGIGLIIFILFPPEKFLYPLWLKCMLIIAALLFLYDGILSLIKPISFSYTEGIFNAGYLFSGYKFSISEIDGYSKISYATRFGDRNGIVLYFNNSKIFELNEILIDGDFVQMVQILLVDIPHYPLKNHRRWFSRFPGSYSRRVL